MEGDSVFLDEDVVNHFLNVFQPRQRLVTSAVVLITGRNQTHNISSETVGSPGVMKVVSLELASSRGTCHYL